MSNADPASGRIAALDLGEVWTGVAVSDAGAIIASPLEVVSAAELTEYLQRFVIEEDVSEILVGVPKTLGGEAGHQARRVFAKLDELKACLPGVRFIEWDERLTTRVALSRAGGRAKGGGRRKVKERLDHLAAAEMLQEYLRAKNRP